MNHATPFFSDIPLRAIPAVQQLFDEAQAPGYSLPLIYSNLVSRLNSAGVSAPARKLVSQWLAAVTLGEATRPEMPAGIPGPDPALAPTPGYFENLPEAAMPALTGAWDAIRATDDAPSDDVDEQAFDAFFDAMLAIGHIEPSWRGFVAFAKAVRSGEVERPARQTVEDHVHIQPAEVTETTAPAEPAPKRKGGRPPKVKPAVAEAEPPAADAAPAQVPGDLVDWLLEPTVKADNAEAALAPPPESRAEPAFAALKSAAVRLFDEVLAQLRQGIEQSARESTARMLREVADEMELGGA